MTEKQIQAAFASKRNLFLTGAAGTGKSYLLKQFLDGRDDVIVCAPTGIAALQLGGETAHKVFHIPVPAYESPSFAKNKKGALTKAMLNPLLQANVVVIDEISMFKNSDFTFAMKVLRKAELLKGSKIRVIVSGDFSQLPPVVRKTDVNLMKKFGFDVSGYPFTTLEWQKLNFKVIELTDVKRQTDVEFVTELNRVRVGDFSHCDYFNQFVQEEPDYSSAICICGTNAEADVINTEYLNGLPGIDRALRAIKTGRVTGTNVDDVLVVKEGARVVFTANDVIRGQYKNGSFGVIQAFYDDCVVVNVDGVDVRVRQQKNSVYQYSATGGKLLKKEIGSIIQYPFRLGKAITIHKSQGQTFDRVVILPTIFAAGQLYVALSRVTSPSGLVLTKEVAPSDFMIDKVVQKFYRDGYMYPVKKKTVKKKTTTSVRKTTKTKPSVKKKTTKRAKKK